MNELDTWLERIGDWYKDRTHDQVERLEPLILTPPDALWGPLITDEQSKGIACWLDGGLRIFTFYRNSIENPHHQEKAYQYLMFAYGKLQAVSCDPKAEPGLQEWCTKRVQHLCVLALEFANQQQEPRWQQESEKLIESHVRFMANQPLNDDQGSVKHQLH
ncbi:transcriptional regulator [Vibrio lentus]|uniref:Transcriptional regulator n=1 Tax=Vibrio lentus TaxID=136468 RepID=A0AB36XFT4_9VIBR|nr:transcriptional regulator [Vibrio lentus]MCC4837175.1 transcriptional regulator [Vibrio lentus]PMI14015.1 transcriptional regulator [Vibrio lentus]PMK29573.1 transcriptional regulator [Vibrio lentus]PMK39566.1 transcriptional regulator [Vibrio lentus]PML32073.1 transcriptional regulator [Vibrio lentus]